MSNPLVKLIEYKRKQWRKDHPYGFVAHPMKLSNGSLNLFNWHCVIPGPPGSIWSTGEYQLNVQFPSDNYQRIYIQFTPPVFHPNVNRCGRISSPVAAMWPGVSIKQILCNCQNLLSNPNLHAPENALAALLYKDDYKEYERRVRADISANHFLKCDFSEAKNPFAN